MVVNLMLLLSHTDARGRQNAVLAFAIQLFTSPSQFMDLNSVLPKYVNLSTGFRVFPLTAMGCCKYCLCDAGWWRTSISLVLMY